MQSVKTIAIAIATFTSLVKKTKYRRNCKNGAEIIIRYSLAINTVTTIFKIS